MLLVIDRFKLALQSGLVRANLQRAGFAVFAAACYWSSGVNQCTSGCFSKPVCFVATAEGQAAADDNDGEADDQAAAASRAGTPTFPQRIATAHLPNVLQLHPSVLSGGLPADRAAFAELQQLGVKTVLSVDGAQPDESTAAEFGLLYVHLPHGYDGISDHRGLELAKALRELEGPIYIHCHHGKHRSPAAATVACVAAGMLPAHSAAAVLKMAGTSPHYLGLHQAAANARPVAPQVLDQLQVEFTAHAQVPALAEAMVQLEHTHERIGQIAAAGWQSPAEHPDLEPAHEALLLREHFAELIRAEKNTGREPEYMELLRDSAEAAESLERSIRAWQAAKTGSPPPQTLDNSARRVGENCRKCHRVSRDLPRQQPTGK
ncbi:hypothetical protein SH139x_004156 [Planctomycetaceae bacterium SH139]